MPVNYLQKINYKQVESRKVDAEEVNISFKHEDRIFLWLGLKYERYVLDIVMPWGNVFPIANASYDSRRKAEKMLEIYEAKLNLRHSIIMSKEGLVEIL